MARRNKARNRRKNAERQRPGAARQRPQDDAAGGRPEDEAGEPPSGVVAGGGPRLWRSLSPLRKKLLGGAGTVLAGVLVVAVVDLLGIGEEKTVVVTGTSATPATGPALRVTGIRHVTRRLDYTWLHPRALGQATVDRLNGRIERAGGLRTEGADEVMRAAGAVEATMQTVEVDVEGNRDAPVTIVNIRVEKQCREPLRGTAFLAPPQGATDTVQLGFELDTPDPVAKRVKPDPNDGPPHFTGDYFKDKKYGLARDEQVTFRLSARSFERHCTYRYRFELDGDSGPPVLAPAKGSPPLQVSAEVVTGDPRLGQARCSAYGRRYASGTFARGATAASAWLSEKDANVPCSG